MLISRSSRLERFPGTLDDRKKKGPRESRGPVRFCWSLAGLCEPTLISPGRVLVDDSLARGAIEHFHGVQLDLGRGAGGVCLLERRTQRRALRAVAHRRGARF